MRAVPRFPVPEALHELGLIDEQVQQALGFKDYNKTSDTKRISTKLRRIALPEREIIEASLLADDSSGTGGN
jgi:hypothetical protein